MDTLSRTLRTLTLGRSQFERLPAPAGLQVRARRGTLWITIDGAPEDIELEPGESYTFASGAPALIGAIGGEAVATLCRRADAPASAAGAWWQRLTDLARAA